MLAQFGRTFVPVAKIPAASADGQTVLEVTSGRIRWRNPADPMDQANIQEFKQATFEHPRWKTHTVTRELAPDQFGEVFFAEIEKSDGVRVGELVWTFSWEALLQSAITTFESSDDAGTVASFYRSDLEPLQHLTQEFPVTIPASLASHARLGDAAATFTETGELVSIAPFSHPNSREVFSILALSRPTSRQFERVAQFRYVFSAILAAALVLALALGTYLARRMIRPLRLVRDGAKRIGAGELDHTLEVKTGDEVQELAQEFNNMTRKLRELYAGMDQTIQERTHELRETLNELQKAHQELIQSEYRYSDLVENASDSIQVTDADGRIRSANRRQVALFQRNLAEIVGSDFLAWVANEHREPTKRALESVLRGDELSAFATVLQVGDHQRIPVEIAATPVIEGTQVVGARAIIRDTRERKQMEAQLIKAERLSSVGALAAGVAHEINNPLGIITMFAQRTLEKAKKGDVDLDKLEKIVQQARRVAQITKGLLDFSRAGPTDFVEFSVTRVIEETVALVAERARRSSIDLVLDQQEHLPVTLGNPQQIGQVILNLLLNALHATDSGGSIHLRATVSESTRLEHCTRAVRVTVADTGTGIPPEALPHLFEPFFTTKGPGEGTGLGLSVSYGIIKEHHGILFAENRPEGGAIFTFELPAP